MNWKTRRSIYSNWDRGILRDKLDDKKVFINNLEAL